MSFKEYWKNEDESKFNQELEILEKKGFKDQNGRLFSKKRLLKELEDLKSHLLGKLNRKDDFR